MLHKIRFSKKIWLCIIIFELLFGGNGILYAASASSRRAGVYTG